MRRLPLSLTRYRTAITGFAVSLALAGCSVLRVDVDVYKGPLANHQDVQVEQLAAMTIGAHPLLVQLRDTMEWGEVCSKGGGKKSEASKSNKPEAVEKPETENVASASRETQQTTQKNGTSAEKKGSPPPEFVKCIEDERKKAEQQGCYVDGFHDPSEPCGISWSKQIAELEAAKKIDLQKTRWFSGKVRRLVKNTISKTLDPKIPLSVDKLKEFRNQIITECETKSCPYLTRGFQNYQARRVNAILNLYEDLQLEEVGTDKSKTQRIEESDPQAVSVNKSASDLQNVRVSTREAKTSAQIYELRHASVARWNELNLFLARPSSKMRYEPRVFKLLLAELGYLTNPMALATAFSMPDEVYSKLEPIQQKKIQTFKNHLYEKTGWQDDQGFSRSWKSPDSWTTARDIQIAGFILSESIRLWEAKSIRTSDGMAFDGMVGNLLNSISSVLTPENITKYNMEMLRRFPVNNIKLKTLLEDFGIIWAGFDKEFKLLDGKSPLFYRESAEREDSITGATDDTIKTAAQTGVEITATNLTAMLGPLQSSGISSRGRHPHGLFHHVEQYTKARDLLDGNPESGVIGECPERWRHSGHPYPKRDKNGGVDINDDCASEKKEFLSRRSVMTNEVTQFASKLLTIANNEVLMKRKDESNDEENPFGVVGTKQLDRNVLVLQAIGNSILVQADELRRREGYMGAMSDIKVLKTERRAALAALKRIGCTNQKDCEIKNNDLDEAQTTMDVLDALISELRYRELTLASTLGDPSIACAKADNTDMPTCTKLAGVRAALKSARGHRSGMVYIRPPAAYLRTSFAASGLQQNANNGWQNMLDDHFWRTQIGGIRFFDKIKLKFSGSSTERDRVETLNQIDKQFWQNINSVRLAAAGNTDYVLVKDDIGNWYAKGMKADPSSIFKGIRANAMFALGGKLNANLLRQMDLRAQLAATKPTDIETRKQLTTELERVEDRNRKSYRSRLGVDGSLTTALSDYTRDFINRTDTEYTALGSALDPARFHNQVRAAWSRTVNALGLADSDKLVICQALDGVLLHVDTQSSATVTTCLPLNAAPPAEYSTVSTPLTAALIMMNNGSSDSREVKMETLPPINNGTNPPPLPNSISDSVLDTGNPQLGRAAQQSKRILQSLRALVDYLDNRLARLQAAALSAAPTSERVTAQTELTTRQNELNILQKSLREKQTNEAIAKASIATLKDAVSALGSATCKAPPTPPNPKFTAACADQRTAKTALDQANIQIATKLGEISILEKKILTSESSIAVRRRLAIDLERAFNDAVANIMFVYLKGREEANMVLDQAVAIMSKASGVVSP